MSLIIEFTLVGGKTRFAADRSKTFDYTFCVMEKREAKRFEDHKAAYAFLARYGFMRRGRSATGYVLSRGIPTVFSGWEILDVSESPVCETVLTE